MLDVEAYDIRSDDFKSSSKRSKDVKKKISKHKIPLLNIKKVLEVKEKTENISESAEEEEEEEDVEEELCTENEKLIPTGSKFESWDSLTRKGSLLRRKEEVIDLLNKCYEYENEESKHISSSQSFIPSENDSSDLSISSSKKMNLEDGEVNIQSIQSESAKLFDSSTNKSGIIDSLEME